jgi:SNF2 family DNA or RNA helicase
VRTIKNKEGLFQQFHYLCRKTLKQILHGSKETEASDEEDSGPFPPSKRKSRVSRLVFPCATYSTQKLKSRSGNSSPSDDEELEDTPRKIRKRKIFENAQARDLREQDRQRLQEQDERRKRLLHKLAQSGHGVNSDRGRIIINDAKHDDQGFVYVHEHIAKRIKDHQIDGVRFMWSQIVTNEDVMQGCLLAHTMGLGKTMQVYV